MKKTLPFEFIYQVIALVVAVIAVHLVYVTVVRPNADAVLAAQAVQAEIVGGLRSRPVTLRRAEGLRAGGLLHPGHMGDGDHGPEGAQLPARTTDAPAKLHRGYRGHEHPARGHPRVLATPCKRFPKTFAATCCPARSLQRCNDSRPPATCRTCPLPCAPCARRSPIGWTANWPWCATSPGRSRRSASSAPSAASARRSARPTRQSKAISPASRPAWAWAFNSTFVALVISIFVMFLMHQLQLIQERLVLDTQHYCDDSLIRHMQVR